jgi:hypothetical protein
MKSPTDFICEPKDGRRYDNTKKFGDVDFIISSSEEDHKVSNRIAVVHELPSRYEGPIKKGAELIVHHNVFKYYNDIKGNKKSGKSFLRDNLFMLDSYQVFAFKNPGCEWVSLDGYSFVKPVKGQELRPMKAHRGFDDLRGRVAMKSPYLSEKGVKIGDMVFFAPDSEYEFRIDGELMYRVMDQSIFATL